MHRRLCAAALCSLLYLSLCLPARGTDVLPADTPAGDGTLPALSAIAGRGLMDSPAYGYLEELSDDIGARVTGTPQAARAVEWGLTKMKSIGLENVHTETWTMWRGWTRISARAELVAPVHRRLTVDSMGWAGSTPHDGIESEVVAVNYTELEKEIRENASRWTGKLLLVIRRPKGYESRGGFGQFGMFLKAAADAHAAGIVGGQSGRSSAGMHLTHTGILGFSTQTDLPVVSMTAEDQELLERFLERGKSVRIKLDVQNRFSPGPVESANVVGEIRGTRYPEQIVVVGAHLDSWDLADGATDNGVGSACTLSAAAAIRSAGVRPERTIRFVLFTGEEQGLLGSFAYVRQHKAEMPNHLAAIVLDNGQGPVVGFDLGGRADLVPAVTKFAGALRSFGEFRTDDDVDFGTDNGPFIVAGLPAINMGQDSPEYRYTHHSAADTLDKVKPEVLARNATLMGLTAFWIASRPERLASPWPAERTARMLVEKRQDIFLKSIGEWPFGDLGQ
jgi:hypothetical protein